MLIHTYIRRNSGCPWLKFISSIRDHINYWPQLEQLINILRKPARAKFDLDTQHTYPEATSLLGAAWRQRCTIMSKATDHRSMFLHEQAAALSSDTNKEKILKGLIKGQERSEADKRFHRVFTPTNTGAIISYLEVPTEQNDNGNAIPRESLNKLVSTTPRKPKITCSLGISLTLDKPKRPLARKLHL